MPQTKHLNLYKYAAGVHVTNSEDEKKWQLAAKQIFNLKMNPLAPEKKQRLDPVRMEYFFFVK